MTTNKKHHWPTLLQDFSKSHLTQKQFCQQRGINPKYFSTRRLQLLNAECDSINPFVKADVVASQSTSLKKASQMRLCFLGAELHFDTAVPATYIASLLRDLS